MVYYHCLWPKFYHNEYRVSRRMANRNCLLTTSSNDQQNQFPCRNCNISDRLQHIGTRRLEHRCSWFSGTPKDTHTRSEGLFHSSPSCTTGWSLRIWVGRRTRWEGWRRKDACSLWLWKFFKVNIVFWEKGIEKHIYNLLSFRLDDVNCKFTYIDYSVQNNK